MRMRRVFWWTVAALAVMAIAAALGGCGENPMVSETVQVPDPAAGIETEDRPEIEEAEPGKKAPDFTVPMVGGGEASLSDYEGKILVLDFWATFCAACVEEFPEYQELYESWDKDKVAYIGMSADGDASTVEAFMSGRPELTLPMAIASDEVMEAYLPSRTLPSARVIDGDGIVRYEFKGASAEKVGEAVRRLLEEDGGAAEGEGGEVGA